MYNSGGKRLRGRGDDQEGALAEMSADVHIISVRV